MEAKAPWVKQAWPSVVLAVGAAATVIVITSGCANQSFQMTSGSTLSPEGMQHLILHVRYPESMASKIPAQTKQTYEAAFFKISKPNIRVVGKATDAKPEQPFYYLNTEVTKYKPGSPFGRFLMTPVIAFGLWGSYVDVDFTIYDPATDVPLGIGVIRKANLWGGYIGGSITSETQLEACPKEIMDDLDSAMKKK
jgi:hypothetical protein